MPVPLATGRGDMWPPIKGRVSSSAVPSCQWNSLTFPTLRPDQIRLAGMISTRAAAIGRSVLWSAIRRRLVIITGKGNNRGRQN